MLSIIDTLHALKADRRGASAIEYALIATGVTIAVIAGLAALGNPLLPVFEYIEANLALNL